MLCAYEHRFLVAEQLEQLDLDATRIILEPVPRNTAPAALVAALVAAAQSPDALILLMPSDHVMADTAGFQRSIESGVPAAQAGRIVTFGVKPDKPETGYGYIQLAAAARSVYPVSRFGQLQGGD